MVLFREVLVEKNGRTTALRNLKWIDLCRVMSNGGYNVVSLTKDRTVYFDKDTPSKYGTYDMKVLESSDEVFDQVIVLTYEPSKIEASISRKQYLFDNMFTEIGTSHSRNESMSSSSDLDKPSNEITTNKIVEQVSIIGINSIVTLNDDQSCEIPFENLENLSCDQFISDELEDDDELEKRKIPLEENLDVVVDENEEKKLSYFERLTLNYQRLILDKLEDLNERVIALEQCVSLLYERQSMERIIKLLNDFYLIDIRELDTRILSSFQSKEMHLFFRFVASRMKVDYSDRWNEIQDWLHISLHPKSIEYNLLGFAKFNKINKQSPMKIIQSPIKLSNSTRHCHRSSYVTFENSLAGGDKNLIVVFEATISKIYFTDNVLCDLTDRNDKYTSSMKKLIRKMCQLERQIYFLSFYYSIGLNQFFSGLVLFQLYREPLINPDQLLNKLMSSETIRQYVPLLYRLHQIHQFILTY